MTTFLFFFLKFSIVYLLGKSLPLTFIGARLHIFAQKQGNSEMYANERINKTRGGAQVVDREEGQQEKQRVLFIIIITRSPVCVLILAVFLYQFFNFVFAYSKEKKKNLFCTGRRKLTGFSIKRLFQLRSQTENEERRGSLPKKNQKILFS